MIQILNIKASMNQVVKISTVLELQESIVAFLHLKGLTSKSTFTRIYLLPISFASWQSGGGRTH